GSAGVDLATAQAATLLDSTVHPLPTGVHGPLGEGRSALLLGRSSTTLAGLFVLPGVIDADYTGEIKIMAWTPTLPCTIPQGARIAQLLFFIAAQKPSVDNVHGDAGFGSTGPPQICRTQQVSLTRPTCQCQLAWRDQHVTLTGLIDTGANVTVIS
ncbi:POK9 protein, partial [Pomatostomus ruficeps]|nr:POK9 protein [Pomatostomus ruficeps]